MKANEFVKKLGWNKAKSLIEKHKQCYMPDVFDMWSEELQDFVLCIKYSSFEMSDLKRLVESHELVERFGGLENSKDSEDLANGLGFGNNGLKQAIADVESCL